MENSLVVLHLDSTTTGSFVMIIKKTNYKSGNDPENNPGSIRLKKKKKKKTKINDKVEVILIG